MSSSDSEDFDFWSWVKLVGLSEANVKKLEHNLVTDFEVLIELRDLDIDALKLGIGDSIRLRAGVAKLRDLNVLPPPLLDAHGKEIKKSEVKATVDAPKIVGVTFQYHEC